MRFLAFARNDKKRYSLIVFRELKWNADDADYADFNNETQCKLCVTLWYLFSWWFLVDRKFNKTQIAHIWVIYAVFH